MKAKSYFYLMRQIKFSWIFVLFIGISFSGFSQLFSSEENFSKEVKNWILVSSYSNAFEIAEKWDIYYNLPTTTQEEKAYLQFMFNYMANQGFNSRNFGFLFFNSFLTIQKNPDNLKEFNRLFENYLKKKDKTSAENLLVNIESFGYNQTLKPIGNIYFKVGGKFELKIDSSEKEWYPHLKFKETNATIFHLKDSLVLYFSDLDIDLKTMNFMGSFGEIEGFDMGLPGHLWKMNQFSFDAKESKFSSYDGSWTYLENLPGAGSINFKEHKRGEPFMVNFTASAQLTKPIEFNDFKAYGRFAIRNSAIGLFSENFEGYLESKDKKIQLRINELWLSNSGKVTIPEASFKAIIGDNDSISHPSIRADFNPEKPYLELRSKKLSKVDRFLYQDSKHQLQISAEIARVYPKENRIDFYRILGKDQIPAWVESYDYFRPERLTYLTKELSFDPLRVLYNYLVTHKQKSAYLVDIASENKRQAESLKGVFYAFRDQGYFIIEQPGDLISFSRIGKHYAEVFFEKKDYDEFIVPSYTSLIREDSSNISLNYDSNDLVVRGVDKINISDSLKSSILPNENRVVFTNGRDFDYEGLTQVGNYQLYGKDLKFHFSDYTIDLPKIDSITFFPRMVDGSFSKKAIGGELKYESGKLELLSPDNKSAKNGIKAYPKLSIPKGVTAYFDQLWRANGAYPKEIYFKVPSIYVDSLLTKELTFYGHFSSGGLVDEFDTELFVQPDQTFGFSYRTDHSLKLYQKRASFTPSIPVIMDKSGLHSAGLFNFKSLQLEESALQIFPDSLKGLGANGRVEPYWNKKKIYPDIQIPNHQFRATKDLDSLIIHPLASSMDFYSNEFTYLGDLYFTDDQYSGMGELKIKENAVISDDFLFLGSDWSFKKGNIRLGEGKFALKPAIILNEVAGKSIVGTKKLDLEEGPLLGSTLIEYPLISYKGEFQQGQWDWEKGEFNFRSKNGLLFSPYTYKTIDSSIIDTTNYLEGYGNILAQGGIYDFEKEELNLIGVEKVRIGPSLIFPYEGKFGIKKGGEFVPFNKARAVLDAENNRHFLSDLIVTRANPSLFKGAGNYLLARPSGDSVKIMFTQFDIIGDATVLNGSYLEAKANFGEKMSLPITQYQDFKGEVLLKSNEPFLQFMGFVKPNLPLSNFKSSWIPFEPKPGTEPVLTVDENLMDEFGRPVTVGIYVNSQNKLYSTFLGTMASEDDPILFNAKGLIRENKENILVEGENNQVKLDIQNKQFETEGPVELFTGNELVRSFGKIKMSTDSLMPHVDTWLSLQFPFQEEVLKAMGERIVKFNLEEGILSTSADEPEDRDAYLNRVKWVLKEKSLSEESLKLMDQNHYPLNKIDPGFNTTINFSKVHLEWLPNTAAFYCVGPMALVNVGPVDVNNIINGYLEIIKRPNKEEFYGYWELSENLWYYFAYFDGEMGVYSSDYEFLAKIRTAVQEDKNKNAGEIRVVEAGSDEKDVFLKRFYTYYKQKEEKPKPSKTTTKQPTKTKAPPKNISKGGF